MIFDPQILQQYRLLFLKLRAIFGHNRFYILNIIKNYQPISVSQIVSETQYEQPIVSQLLSILRKAGYVQVESRGKEKFYSINNEELKNIIKFSSEFMRVPDKLNADLKDAYAIISLSYRYLKDLLNPVRLSILELINKAGELNVSELTKHSQQSQSIISQNLKILKELKLVISEQRGKRIYYKIDKANLEYHKKTIQNCFS